MEYTQDDFFREICKDIHDYMRFTDIYNVVQLGRNSTAVDVHETFRVFVALNLLSIQDQPVQYQRSVLNLYGDGLRKVLTGHHVGSEISSWDRIIKDAEVLAKNPDECKRKQAELFKKVDFSVDFQSRLKNSLLMGFTRVKIGGTALVKIADTLGGVALKRIALNEAVCESSEYKRLRSLIYIEELSFKLTPSDF